MLSALDFAFKTLAFCFSLFTRRQVLDKPVQTAFLLRRFLLDGNGNAGWKGIPLPGLDLYFPVLHPFIGFEVRELRMEGVLVSPGDKEDQRFAQKE